AGPLAGRAGEKSSAVANALLGPSGNGTQAGPRAGHARESSTVAINASLGPSGNRTQAGPLAGRAGEQSTVAPKARLGPSGRQSLFPARGLSALPLAGCCPNMVNLLGGARFRWAPSRFNKLAQIATTFWMAQFIPVTITRERRRVN